MNSLNGRRYLWLILVSFLAGCNWIESLSKGDVESDKALGAGCRQTGRSLEECYTRHAASDRAAIYAGWKEMSEYMTKHKLEVMPKPVDKEASGTEGGTMGEGEKSASEGTGDPQVQAIISKMNSENKPQGGESAGKANKQILNIINTEKRPNSAAK